jgi:hypothetical protein
MPLIVVNKNTPLAAEIFSRIGKVVALDTLEVSRDAVHDAEILVVRSSYSMKAPFALWER